MILICEEYCFRHHLASATEKVAARERFNNAVSEAAGKDGGFISVREIFHTAQPLKRGTRCKDIPQGVTVIVHLHEAEDSRWTDLTQQ
jgi:hypothetical protein